VHAQSPDTNVVSKVENLLLDANFQGAIDLIDSAGNLSSLLLENKKAEAYTRQGRLNDAETVLKLVQAKLTSKPDAFVEAVTQTNIGLLQLHQGRNDLAEKTLQKAVHGFMLTGNTGHIEGAQAFANLGLVYMSLGKYKQAQEQLHMALSLRQTHLNDHHELIAATYNDLGLVYSQTDKDKALDYFEKASTVYTALHGTEHNKNAIANINIGIVYRDLKLYGDAVNNFETALKIWNKVYPGPHPAKAMALSNLGETYLKMHDNQAAMSYYVQSHKMYEASYGDKHPEIAYILNAIGRVHLSAGRVDEALETYHKAVIANVQDFNNVDLKTNPALQNYYHGTRLLHSLLFKAEAWEARYLRKSLKFGDLVQALNVLHKCDSLIDQLRHQSSNESDKLQLGVIADDVYTSGVRVAYEAGINAFNKMPYFKKAFYFAEKSKSAVLLESISDADA
jgi:tetratricopeptide (TPR) repeat protein